MEINNSFFNVFKNKKILITGDTGFKGSWLAIWLLKLGAEVYGYSLPPKTERDNYVVTNLKEKIKHINGDIRDAGKLLNFFKVNKPDFAFHLAAQPLVIDAYKNPRYTFETNILGTVNFFEAVRDVRTIKVAINITTDKCYKNNEWIWGYRENDPLEGRDPYSASKACSELLTYSYLESFFKDSECNIGSARAGNVIGAGDWAENRIIPDFFRAKLNKRKLLIRNPFATRPWQHVLEPLSGYLLLAAKLFESDSFVGGWNFGPKDEKNYSVKQLVDKMLNFDSSVGIKLNDSANKLHEANFLKLDISKAVSYLNWTPVLDFENTVNLTVKGYLSDIGGDDSFKNRLDTIKEYVNSAKDSDYL